MNRMTNRRAFQVRAGFVPRAGAPGPQPRDGAAALALGTVCVMSLQKRAFGIGESDAGGVFVTEGVA
jgi:hypothetical protein